jgi:hypothetical protein
VIFYVVLCFGGGHFEKWLPDPHPLLEKNANLFFFAIWNLNIPNQVFVHF